MFVYMTVIFLIIIFSHLAKIESANNYIKTSQKKNSVFFIFLIYLVLGIVAGLRFGVGTDYWTYAYLYDSYKEFNLSEFSFLNEPGIQIISKLSSIIYDDYAMMFFIASMITIFLIVKTLANNTSMLTLSLVLLILTGVWHGTFNGVRQYIAVAIIFAGHEYIIEKKKVKYFLIVVLASLFHVSALACLILYFIPTKKLKLKHIFFLVIFVFIFTRSYDVLLNIVENLRGQTITTTNYATQGVSLPRILTKVSPVFFFLFFTDEKMLTKQENFYINIMFINTALVIATLNSIYLSRLWMYTDLFSVLFYPVLIINMKQKRYRTVITLMIITLFSIFWFYEVIITENLYNFKWIFER